MKKIIRREILIETEQVAYITRREGVVSLECEICGDGAPMIYPEKITENLAIGTRLIYRMIETDRIHFLETDDRKVFACLNTLFGALNNSEPVKNDLKGAKQNGKYYS